MARPSRHMTRITIITKSGQIWRESRKVVDELVRRGLAYWITDKVAQVECSDLKVPVKCGQAETYFDLATEPHPHIVLGGLTRTEHQPSVKPSILRWGHIDNHKNRRLAKSS